MCPLVLPLALDPSALMELSSRAEDDHKQLFRDHEVRHKAALFLTSS